MKRKLSKVFINNALSRGIPAFKCKIDWNENRMMYFDCPFCLSTHRHGIDQVAPFEPTHRVSHCNNKVLRKTGYYVYHEGK